LKELVEQGYVIVKRKYGKPFAKNVYELPETPFKYLDAPPRPELTEFYEKVRNKGLRGAAGYGIIPKAVKDERTDSRAKLFYAYYSVFGGAGEERSAHNRLRDTLWYLQISERTYYRHYRQLIDTNYVTAVQRHKNGRYGVNDYHLNAYPNCQKEGIGKKAFKVTTTKIWKE
jgi:hypothetical protein